jgi:hypothetical protein
MMLFLQILSIFKPSTVVKLHSPLRRPFEKLPYIVYPFVIMIFPSPYLMS